MTAIDPLTDREDYRVTRAREILAEVNRLQAAAKAGEPGPDRDEYYGDYKVWERHGRLMYAVAALLAYIDEQDAP